ncbi:MAG: hypothetical protein EBE86_030100 [Hormoscilla sp. GUM202]|nr:hypothetical protein [Hormoscilla sp. GUM202]
MWTRSTALGDVTFEYATDPNFLTIVCTARMLRSRTPTCQLR